jgi:hypothetical protein
MQCNLRRTAKAHQGDFLRKLCRHGCSCDRLRPRSRPSSVGHSWRTRPRPRLAARCGPNAPHSVEISCSLARVALLAGSRSPFRLLLQLHGACMMASDIADRGARVAAGRSGVVQCICAPRRRRRRRGRLHPPRVRHLSESDRPLRRRHRCLGSPAATSKQRSDSDVGRRTSSAELPRFSGQN